MIHWKLCEKHNFERKEKWYKHCLEEAVENDDVKLIWDINIQCDCGKKTRLKFGGQKGEIMRHH